ncbi:MAG: OsmC family protein [Gammaproteobacteria bacterium]|jgi:organic hydroperoxide reductase OsmC/OhrA
MEKLPHHYTVYATVQPEGDVSISATDLETIPSAPPREFGGPGNRWSPESLLVAAVADCFVLSFRAVASASKLSWASLECEVEGKLERSERTTKFTEFEVAAKLTIPQDTLEEKALRALEKAEAICLITNSLSGKTHLKAEVTKLA